MKKPNGLLQPLGKLRISSQRALYRVVVFAKADDDRRHHVPFSDSGSEKRLIEKHRAAAAIGHFEMIHTAVNMDHLGKTTAIGVTCRIGVTNQLDKHERKKQCRDKRIS